VRRKGSSNEGGVCSSARAHDEVTHRRQTTTGAAMQVVVAAEQSRCGARRRGERGTDMWACLIFKFKMKTNVDPI
jgi:hypothetical protein